MAEVKFAIKALVVASVITVFLQYKYKEISLESHALNWLQHSASAIKLREVAKGASLALGDISNAGKRFARDTFSSERVNAEAQRASR